MAAPLDRITIIIHKGGNDNYERVAESEAVAGKTVMHPFCLTMNIIHM